MSRTCKSCGELLEVKCHKNLDNLDKQTLEIQTCISCSWTTTVKL